VIPISGINGCKWFNDFQIKSEEKKVDMEGEEKERDPKPGLLGLVMFYSILLILNHVDI
jgi:hypothetical protein